jgi:hypothetical protein
MISIHGENALMVILECHLKGGVNVPRPMLIKQQENNILAFRENGLQKVGPSLDPISYANVCGKGLAHLKEVKIEDLKAHVIQPDTILWLKIITESMRMRGVTAIVEDDDNTAMLVMLYNETDAIGEAVKEEFGLNTRIGIKNPYRKVSFNGSQCLRNDNPQNIVYAIDES